MSIAAPEIERLRKVYRLMESPVAAEAAAALAMTKALLAKHGMRMSDLPGLLNGNGSSSTSMDDLVAATVAATHAAMAAMAERDRKAEENHRKVMEALRRKQEAETKPQ
jgi:hypothetical protein